MSPDAAEGNCPTRNRLILVIFGVSLAALDFAAARSGIGRDVSEFAGAGAFGWAVLSLVFGLPIAALALLVLRRWLALVPMLESVGLFSLWFLYYATGWLPNQEQGVWMPAVGLVVIGWLFVLAAATDALRPLHEYEPSS